MAITFDLQNLRPTDHWQDCRLRRPDRGCDVKVPAFLSLHFGKPA